MFSLSRQFFNKNLLVIHPVINELKNFVKLDPKYSCFSVKNNGQIVWTQKVDLPKEHFNANKEAIDDICKFIKLKHHDCIPSPSISGIDWCKCDICKYSNLMDKHEFVEPKSFVERDDYPQIKKNMEKMDADNMKFAEMLISDGHKCICYLESYPVRIDWCGQDVCIYK
jgi:hypothetical protein